MGLSTHVKSLAQTIDSLSVSLGTIMTMLPMTAMLSCSNQSVEVLLDEVPKMVMVSDWIGFLGRDDNNESCKDIRSEQVFLL